MRQSLENVKKKHQEIQNYFESNNLVSHQKFNNNSFDNLIKSYKILTLSCVGIIALVFMFMILYSQPHSLTSSQVKSYEDFTYFIRNETKFLNRSLPSYTKMNSFYKNSVFEDKDFLYSQYVNGFEDYIRKLSRHLKTNEKKGLNTSYEKIIQEELIISQYILHKMLTEEKISPLTSNDMQEIIKKLDSQHLSLSRNPSAEK